MKNSDNEDNLRQSIIKEGDTKKPNISRPKTQSNVRSKINKDQSAGNIGKLDEDKQNKKT